MAKVARSLPPLMAWILIRRIPCALLATVLFEGILWVSGTVLSLPFLVFHFFTPMLFAVIALGGGTAFAIHSALLSGVFVTLLAGFNTQPGLLLFILYGLFPILAVRLLHQKGGLEKSARNLLIGLGATVLGAVLSGAAWQHISAQTWVAQVLIPFFDVLEKAQTANGQMLDKALMEHFQSMTVWIFPGMSALLLWLLWWGNTLLARWVAVRYGFYDGDMRPLSFIRFGSRMAYVFLGLILLGLITAGMVQYLAVNTLIPLSGLLAIQGLAVAYIWLRARKFYWMGIMMFFALLMQPVMVLPFIVIGLFDIWFDYRRNQYPTSGGE